MTPEERVLRALDDLPGRPVTGLMLSPVPYKGATGDTTDPAAVNP